MDQRLQLHDILKGVLGSSNVYFQPPPNVQMQYPCIVYNRDMAHSGYADNNPYRYTQRYQVMVIDRDPDSGIPKKVASLPMTSYSRFFVADDLNHDVFTLYY